MPYFSSYLVDGGSIWLPHSANIDQGESETVAEVNVITSTASAQYGGGGTVFNVISKSGTKQFHGALYDYFQNDALNARDYFNTDRSQGEAAFQLLWRRDRWADPQGQVVLLLQLSTVGKPQ